jgi:hypothetical protein
LDLNLK